MISVTSAEFEVWREISMGKTLKEVAEILGIHRSTVDKHRTSLYAKIGARCISDATRTAISYHVIAVPMMPGQLYVSKPCLRTGRRRQPIIAGRISDRAPARAL